MAWAQSAVDLLSPCELNGIAGETLCGTISVPADHTNPQSFTQIDLRVVVLRATDTAQRQPDPVVYLAGGPGASAVASARDLAESLQDLRRTRDLVLVDQRGTGESTPFNCRLTDADGYGMPLASLSFALDLIEICALGPDGGGDRGLLGVPELHGGLFTTWQAVEDLAQVTALLGYSELNLYGVSYGARTGLVFLNRHPERVRTLTVQSVVLPSLPIPLAGTLAADASLRRMLDDCAAETACHQAYPKLREQATELLSRRGESALVFNTAVAAALYDPNAAARLPMAIERASVSNYTPLLRLAAGSRGRSNVGLAVGAYLSVLCTEDVPYLTEDDVARAAATLFTDRNVRGLIRTCSTWIPVELPEGGRDLPESEKPVLLIAGELDPVTSADQAEMAAERLPGSRLVVLQATGHSGAGNTCAVSMLTGFIEAGQAGAVDTGCASEGKRPPFVVPEPVGQEQEEESPE